MDGLVNIFARNCELRRVDAPTADAFLDRWHRLGTTGARYRYGLFVKRSTGRAEFCLAPGTLVAVATFSAARSWDNVPAAVASESAAVLPSDRKWRSCEWVRYASVDGLRVVGGMGKLLQAFIDEVRPDDVMSYADASSPDLGSVYHTLGFTQEAIIRRDGFTNIKFRKILTI